MAHNTPRMAWAWRSESSSQSGLRSPVSCSHAMLKPMRWISLAILHAIMPPASLPRRRLGRQPTFHGLTLGRAHREDALRVAGRTGCRQPHQQRRRASLQNAGQPQRRSHGSPRPLRHRHRDSGVVPRRHPAHQALQRVRQGCTDRTLLAGQVCRRCALSRSARGHRTHALSGARNRSLARSVRLRFRRHSLCCASPLDLRGRRPAFRRH